MTQTKQRLTVTVDPEVVEAGEQAVRDGSADSLSGWVNAALVDRAARDERLRHLRAAVQDYEAEFGEISEEEMLTQERSDREQARVVRGRQTKTTKPRRRA